MDTSAPAPSVNGELMSRFAGKKVLLVGKTEGSDGSTVTLRTSDDKVVTVTLAADSPAITTAFVEFEGICNGEGSITEVSHVDFGDEFDMYTYNELAKESNGRSAALFM